MSGEKVTASTADMRIQSVAIVALFMSLENAVCTSSSSLYQLSYYKKIYRTK